MFHCRFPIDKEYYESKRILKIFRRLTRGVNQFEIIALFLFVNRGSLHCDI